MWLNYYHNINVKCIFFSIYRNVMHLSSVEAVITCLGKWSAALLMHTQLFTEKTGVYLFGYCHSTHAFWSSVSYNLAHFLHLVIGHEKKTSYCCICAETMSRTHQIHAVCMLILILAISVNSPFCHPYPGHLSDRTCHASSLRWELRSPSSFHHVIPIKVKTPCRQCVWALIPS